MIALAKSGVPWHEAATWSPARRAAALIILGELNGGKFNWSSWTMDWPQT